MLRRLAIIAASLVLFGGLSACERRGGPAGTGQSAPNVAPLPGAAPSSFAPIIKQVSPAVVSIDTLTVGAVSTPFGQDLSPGVVPGVGQVPVRRGAGSGFVI